MVKFTDFNASDEIERFELSSEQWIKLGESLEYHAKYFIDDACKGDYSREIGDEEIRDANFAISRLTPKARSEPLENRTIYARLGEDKKTHNYILCVDKNEKELIDYINKAKGIAPQTPPPYLQTQPQEEQTPPPEISDPQTTSISAPTTTSPATPKPTQNGTNTSQTESYTGVSIGGGILTLLGAGGLVYANKLKQNDANNPIPKQKEEKLAFAGIIKVAACATILIGGLTLANGLSHGKVMEFFSSQRRI